MGFRLVYKLSHLDDKKILEFLAWVPNQKNAKKKICSEMLRS
jgi:hypothetical protein